MINLHDKLWVCIAASRNVEDAKYNLAYMTHAEYNKDCTPKDNFVKRKATGEGWTKQYRNGGVGSEFEFDNNPLTGFSIVGSASRWSTDNKLILIEDPRGFVVEIPVSALTTLLKYTTTVSGVIQEECLWGKEGNNHILIPVNSDAYRKARLQTTQLQSKVKLSKLTEGDIIKFNPDGDEYCYVGRYKVLWNVSERQSVEKHKWNDGWTRSVDDPVIKTDTVAEDGYRYLFKNLNNDRSWDKGDNKVSGEVIIVGKAAFIPDFQVSDFRIYAKKGFMEDDRKYDRHSQTYLSLTPIALIKKEEKK
jgi:hypothetical protein